MNSGCRPNVPRTPPPYDRFTQEDTMPETDTARQWVHRCAQRLQLRHTLSAADAIDLAHKMLTGTGQDDCPERAADDLFLRTPLET